MMKIQIISQQLRHRVLSQRLENKVNFSNPSPILPVVSLKNLKTRTFRPSTLPKLTLPSEPFSYVKSPSSYLNGNLYVSNSTVWTESFDSYTHSPIRVPQEMDLHSQLR